MGRYVMKMPDVGEGVVEAEIVEWLVRAADLVAEDQHIVDVMTEKVTMEITSPVAGTVVSVHGEPGDMVAVGAQLIELQTEADVHVRSDEVISSQAIEVESTVAATARLSTEAETEAVPVAVQKVARPDQVATSSCQADSRPLTSPSVRRRAREANVDLIQLTGTGRNGRISHADLNRYIATAQTSVSPAAQPRRSDVRQVKVIGLRRVIAKKVALSKRIIPHFSYIEEVDLTELESLRLYLNAERKEKQVKLTYLPFFMLALGKLLVEFPQCNAHCDDAGGMVTQFDAVHIGVATQTSMGLKVPVVKHAEALDLWGLAEQVIRVSDGARNSRLSNDELTGSTITISSLGALGGVASTPVINHPEVAIIGVNKTLQRPVIMAGQVVPRLMMNLSSSFDHRVVDGYDAARFIQAFKGMLEHPATMFL